MILVSVSLSLTYLIGKLAIFKNVNYTSEKIDFLSRLNYLSLCSFIVSTQLAVILVLNFIGYEASIFELAVTLQLFLCAVATLIMAILKRKLK